MLQSVLQLMLQTLSVLFGALEVAFWECDELAVGM
jgi:hypothetical protein